MYIPLVVGLSRTVLYFYCSQHAIARVRLTLMFISLYPVGCLVYCTVSLSRKWQGHPVVLLERQN